MTVSDRLAQQSAGRALVAARLADVVGRVWTGLGSWDEADVERFLARVVPLIEAGQLQAAALTDVYIASVLSEMTGRPVTPVGLGRRDVTGLRPVPAQEVYRRPFVEVWAGLSRGLAHEDAVSRGRDRLLRLVEDDVSLAHRHTSRAAFSARGVTRYRRVVRPELARTGTCGLCIAASDQIYSSDQLLPIHTRCGCDVMPIVGENDPGRTLNGEDIEEIYKGLGTSDRSELAKARVTVREHGELGPVLRRAEDNFTGPADLAA